MKPLLLAFILATTALLLTTSTIPCRSAVCLNSRCYSGLQCGIGCSCLKTGSDSWGICFTVN